MAQKLDLGRSTLRIRDSKLQLRLAASAHFNQPSCGTPQITIDLSHLPNLESVWITEAPELDLRLSIGGNWDGNEAAAFVSNLRGKLCDMEIWSDLGFSVELKTSVREYCTDTSGFHCLELGLRRECRIQNRTMSRTLPSSMTNPPDACPPPGIPVAILASIDVRLEYHFPARDIPQAQEYSELKVGILGQQSSVFSSSQLLETTAEVSILQPVHDGVPSEAVRSQSSYISGDVSHPRGEELFRLFDLGIQRLLISNSIKDPTVCVSQKVTIKSFAGIAPGVFDPGYRDAINQRGVTIPVITKAISSMLEGNKDPCTKARLANLLHTDNLRIQPQVPSCRAVVLSSLWRVAQKNVPKIKPIKRRTLTLSAECLSNRLAASDEAVRRMCTDQLQVENGNSEQGRSFQIQDHHQNEESDVCLLNSESEDQLLDNFSETSFTDIGESTQTSLDTLFSIVGSSQTSHGDYDTMLLSNHDGLEDYPGNYVTNYDPREDMEAYDMDMIMADNL
ncbi:unnamed protein product [Penicillium glandicola]